MAWPLTPLQTYVDNSAPGVSASDLNSIQNAINQAFLGTYSYKAIQVDGTGGNAVTPTAGTIQVSANGISTTTPTTSVSPGVIYKDFFPFAGGQISSGAVINCGWNISSVGHSVTGQFVINLVNSMAATAKHVLIATPFSNAAGMFAFESGSASLSSVNVYTYNNAGTATDVAFNFVLYASS